LQKIASFEIKLIRPYWKITDYYEILLELKEDKADTESITLISNFVCLFEIMPNHLSEKEAIWSDLPRDFFLPHAKWVHLEVT
jgi:hypothetical protein